MQEFYKSDVEPNEIKADSEELKSKNSNFHIFKEAYNNLANLGKITPGFLLKQYDSTNEKVKEEEILTQYASTIEKVKVEEILTLPCACKTLFYRLKLASIRTRFEKYDDEDKKTNIL